MVNADLIPPRPKVRSRQIEASDVEGVVDLLTRGFAGQRTREFWEHVLASLGSREWPRDLPRYGYLLESGGAIVGAILQIFSRRQAGATVTTRCNVSSWYVDPAFRSYAALLVAQALKHKDVTYLNISPAPHTRRIAEIQGYTRYRDGIFIAVPAFSRAPAQTDIRIIDACMTPSVDFDPRQRDMLQEHTRYGCVSLWCETPERAYPLVVRPRLVKRLLPCAQLIYCSGIDDFVRFARPIGRFLALRGQPLVIIDANGPIPGLVGKYFSGRPKYFKGPDCPGLGDLAHTEAALFGV
jgi:hypothetical protein